MNLAGQNAGAPTWLVRHRRRLAECGVGHTMYAMFNWQFDNVVYVYAIYRLGLLAGGALMTLLSMLQCAALLVIYERMRIDWVGAGSIARFSGAASTSWWQPVIQWAMRRGQLMMFLALCIFQDPFITTAYFRGGRFDGLRVQDWRVFFASVLVSNGYWTLRSGAVAALVVSMCHRVAR